MCFNPRTRGGVRRLRDADEFVDDLFQSTHPRGGCDDIDCHRTLNADCFNPRTRGGVRQKTATNVAIFSGFQSTHPRGGATWQVCNDRMDRNVSIHAPAGGCDFSKQDTMTTAYVSIHAPAGGCDYVGFLCFLHLLVFQSTHPRGGATGELLPCCWDHWRFNPRTRGGVRRRFNRPSSLLICVSIHAPAGGCDPRL